MQSETGCKINVSQASGADIEREIGLVGSRQAIDDAKQAIWDKVDQVVSPVLCSPHKVHANFSQKEKNNNRRRDQGGQDNSYSQQQQPQQSYGQVAPQGLPSAPTTGAPAAGTADPYAIYGGYQNYLAMWYASFAQQQQQGGAPPGPSGA